MAGLSVGSEVAGYRIEAVAGEGGMGIVYLATQLALQRRVALKVIAPDLARDPRFRERFKRESLLAASIEHPNVIPVYEAGERDGMLYLVMRYVEGTDLFKLLELEGALEPARAARLLSQVAAALGAGHRQGLVHRDVKPANVLVVPGEDDEHAYITDFGIAREMAATGGVTRTGAVVGTVDYLAPERLEGDRGDARSDVYAFGCMLFESLSGEIPFPRDSDVAKMFAHLNAEPPRLDQVRPGLPPALVEVVERCMAKNPAQRYADAGELARVTAAAVGGGPSTVEPQGAPAPVPAGPPTTDPGLPPTEHHPPPTGAGLPPTEHDAPPTGAELPPTEHDAPPTGAELPPTDPGASKVESEPPPSLSATQAPAQTQGPAQPQAPAQPASSPELQSPSPAPTTQSLEETKKRLPVGALVALFVAVIAAGVLIVTIAGGGGGAPEQSSGGGGTGATVRVPGGPDGVTVAGGKVWVAGAEAGTLTPIDAGSRSVGRPVKVGGNPDSVTSASGSVWVTNTDDGTVSRVDETSGEPRGRPIPVGDAPEGIAAGDGSVWVANAGDGTVSRIDAASGRPRGTAQVGGAPIGVATGPGTVWVTDNERGALIRYSSSSGQPQGQPIQVGAEPRGVAVSGDQVWVANSGDGTVSRINADSGQQAGDPIEVGGNPREVASAAGDGVWVTLFDKGQAIRIDNEGQVAERKKVGSQPLGVAVDDASVWVASLGDDSVTQIPR